MLLTASKYLDIDVWNNQLALRGNQVCRIGVLLDDNTSIYSTGFLIGPNLVITSYHNISQVVEEKIDPSNITLRFNYKRLADNQTLDMGVECHLAPNGWLIDHSPTEALDYALLLVERDIGCEMIPGRETVIMRGWIELLEREYHFNRGEPLLILQHPFGQPLKVAFSSDAAIDLDDNEVRITYNVNTQPGSSGAPCFNVDLDLIALHEGANFNLQANQGINMYAILQSLISQGLQDLVSKKVPGLKDQILDDSLKYSDHFPSDPSVKAIIDLGESPTTEFKVGSIRNPHTGERDDKMRYKVLEAVAAFMNSFDGGKVIIGVANDKTIVGINEEYKIVNKARADWDSYELFLRGVLNNNLSISNPYLLYKIKLHQIEGKDVCSIAVLPADEPVYIKSSFFVRTGNQTIELSMQKHGHYILRRWSPK